MKILAVVAVIMILATSPFATRADAQDLATLLNQAVAAGDEMIGFIQAGLATTDIAAARAQARLAMAAGDRWQALLGEALTLAPDDASRSRIEGVLVHVRDASRSANLAVTGPDAEVMSRLDAARGEAEEAQAELRPFAPSISPIAPPAVLPRTGEISAWFLSAVGAALFAIGLGLRRLRPTLETS
jgi:LPXTG-motif cell wall-anchored protein